MNEWTVAEFLLARITEEQAAAQACADAGDTCALKWNATTEPGMSEQMDHVHDHVSRWDSVRVLAECEAKRRIVEQIDRNVRDVPTGWSERILELLALPYADHPDYDEGWRP